MSRSLKWETAALLLGSLTCSLLLQGEAQSESPGDPVVVTEISKSSPTGTTEVPRIPGTVPDVSVATIPQGSGKTEKLEGRRRIRQTGKRPWGPEQVEGAPDTAGSGDLVTAWASRSTDDQAEWLLCEYESAVRVATVRVHETYNPGSLVKVTAFNADGEEVLAWEGEDPTPRDKLRGISVIPVDLEFPVSRIKLYFDSPSVPGWNEIDAVGIDDLDGEQHWARKVTASSTYAEPNVLIADGAMSNRSWGPEQAAGEPNTPGFGDAVTAWASASQDGQREWLICEYENPMMPDEIVVHENYAPGAVDRITALNDSDEETLLWEGIDPTDRSQPRGISVFPVTSDEPIKRIKIYLDSPAVPDWNEIDAVGLRKDEETQWAVKVEASSTYAAQSNFSPIPATTVMISADQLMELQEQVQQLTEQVAELKSQADDITALKDEIEALRKLLKAQLKVE